MFPAGLRRDVVLFDDEGVLTESLIDDVCGVGREDEGVGVGPTHAE